MINHPLIIEELNKTTLHHGDKNFQPRLHYARASDLARISILIQLGGIYTDTDTQALLPLPTLHAEYGTLCKKKQKATKANLYQFKKTFPNFTDMILYDFIAATPNNQILLTAAEISRSDYQTYHQLKQDNWGYIDCNDFHLHMTIMLTGTALRCAMNHFTITNKIASDKSKDMFFDDSLYFLSTYDKSWLDLDKIEHLSTDEALKRLLQEPSTFSILSAVQCFKYILYLFLL